VVVGNIFYCLDIIFFRCRRSMLVNFLNYDCFFSNLRGGKDTLHHPVPEGKHIANRDTRRHLYCMRGVGVGSFFCYVEFFRLRRIV
jgi:hypothetical protein